MSNGSVKAKCLKMSTFVVKKGEISKRLVVCHRRNSLIYAGQIILVGL
jgi:hypothetical protein